jgi:hypothetical protein
MALGWATQARRQVRKCKERNCKILSPDRKVVSQQTNEVI